MRTRHFNVVSRRLCFSFGMCSCSRSTVFFISSSVRNGILFLANFWENIFHFRISIFPVFICHHFSFRAPCAHCAHTHRYTSFPFVSYSSANGNTKKHNRSYAASNNFEMLINLDIVVALPQRCSIKWHKYLTVNMLCQMVRVVSHAYVVRFVIRIRIKLIGSTYFIQFNSIQFHERKKVYST